MKNNTDRTLESFNEQLTILRENGYNPIAVSQMYFEDTFVFETKEEADRGYLQFERDKNEKWIGEVVGWWYSKEDFLKAVKEYEEESEFDSTPITFWL